MVKKYLSFHYCPDKWAWTLQATSILTGKKFCCVPLCCQNFAFSTNQSNFLQGQLSVKQASLLQPHYDTQIILNTLDLIKLEPLFGKTKHDLVFKITHSATVSHSNLLFLPNVLSVSSQRLDSSCILHSCHDSNLIWATVSAFTTICCLFSFTCCMSRESLKMESLELFSLKIRSSTCSANLRLERWREFGIFLKCVWIKIFLSSKQG